MDAGGGEAELARLRAESDRVAQSLLAMDDHPGHRLLRGTTLAGETARRWESANAAMVGLWEWFDAYRAVLAQAGATRDAAERRRLLTGPEVVLAAPPPARTLTSPAVAAERITLAELVTRMKHRYAELTALFDEVHAAWSARLAVLDPVAGRLAGLAESGTVRALRAEVAAAHARAVADPLTPDAAAAGLADRAAGVAALLEGFAARVAAVTAVLAEAGAVRDEVVALRVVVVAEIAGEHPATPEVSGPAGALAGLRLRFPEVRERELTEVESAAAAVLERTRAVAAQLAGSVERRAELRGRLDAYRAKATARGHAEDAALAALHRAARDVLHAVPCDLRAGTVAVARYQRAVQDRTEAAR
ncbi:hypothetical protein BN6_42090 [Saccharothrix espanaensis DSM 44229]|uniref:Uncharacterized protein n=1 Tax=Saccharothrix espanaensis (strain ATCC 51144 / DSM 44229 / JCM 9112 / NBRC 15066 / NRRL 15764) TaxID=1179773 RepID=K0JZG2_SACES|nr:hypothetical protein BN6_42090 [Saccharothrix espanaensis DSM 44229]